MKNLILGSSTGLIESLGTKRGKSPICLYLRNFAEKKADKYTQILKRLGVLVQTEYSHSSVKKLKLLWERAIGETYAEKKAFLAHERLKIKKDIVVLVIPRM